jgi:hypothetical protein
LQIRGVGIDVSMVVAVVPPRLSRASAHFLREVERARLVPLPGAGNTVGRFRFLTDMARIDLAVARLIEGHLDAIAILAEAERRAPLDAVMGVWAAKGRDAALAATPIKDGWRLRGAKPYASGASTLTHALVTADTPTGSRLFLIETAGTIRIRPGSWQAVGMRESDSPTVEIDASVVSADSLGDVDWYVRRPGFWHGAVGVAACWLGGAWAVAKPLERANSPHALAHLGAVDAGLAAADALLTAAAREIDEAPFVGGESAERRARRVRAVTEAAASDAIDRVGRALGAGPLCHDADHAQRVADLSVYLRQSHAEVDLARLGELVTRDT